MQWWFWIPPGALVVLALYQQLRIYRIHRVSRDKEELFRIVTENAADMIALVDVKGHRLYNSPSYKRILGYSAGELGETSAFEQIHPEDRFRVLEAAREARETGVGKRLEYRVKHKDGSWRVLESVASVVRDARGEVAKLVIVNRDITERKRAEQQLEHNLFHDALTGLPNRRLFLDRLQRLFAKARRAEKEHCGLLLANIDHFKGFNERLGTAVGDQILQELARRIGNSLRQSDTVSRDEGEPSAEPVLSRLGGDEFTILLDSVSDPSDAMRVARRIQAAVAEPVSFGTHEMRASVSIGIALSTNSQERPEDLLKDADAALRRAKALGGSRSEVFDEAMHIQAIGRLRLEGDLQRAMAERQFRVHYLPVVELASRRVISLEALLRWEHPAHGLMSPDRFLEAAEDTGLLVSIGHWLILQVCRQMREWDSNQMSGQSVHVTVNVSARQFADARLSNDIRDALHETGIEPSRLQLEISENVAAPDPRLTITVLRQLKQIGIGAILDDFGTGSCSLGALRQFPVDALKIDRALIREMQSDLGASEMVELLALLARKMKLKLIAEGIETAKQIEQLQQLGCELGQGYYFSQPMDANAVMQFVRQHDDRFRSQKAAGAI